MSDLFSTQPVAPLAERLRPKSLKDLTGQEHLLGPESSLRLAVRAQSLPSCILLGPCGTGKTSMATLLAKEAGLTLMNLHAAHSGVKELRAVADAAQHLLDQQQKRSALFVDEVHSLSKAQQDVLLPLVESGLVTLIGATTEQPAFHLNAALLSRVQVFVLKSLDAKALHQLYQRALPELEGVALAEETLAWLYERAAGDGRKFLSDLELVSVAARAKGTRRVALAEAQAWLPEALLKLGRQTDQLYDQISALQKSVRGSQPDAALFWLAQLLQSGADPRYVIRRLTVMASEEVGAADPMALVLATAAAGAYEKLGPAEGERALAQLAVHLACAPKSNAVYSAWNEAQAYAKRNPQASVPLQLRNAPDSLSKAWGHGQGYRYAHDEPESYAAGMSYWPDDVRARAMYRPKEVGAEAQVVQRLAHWKSLDEAARQKDDSSGGSSAV